MREGPEAVGIVVSVGTARGELGRQKEFFFGRLKRKAVQTVADASDPGLLHNEIRALSKRAPRFEYYRIDPEDTEEAEANHLLNMPLDEWKPRKGRNGAKSGTTTIKAIVSAFDSWSGELLVQNAFRDCAVQLVAQRRLRAKDKAQWERYAMVTEYKCEQSHCKLQDRTWTDLRDYTKHMHEEHHVHGEDFENERQKAAYKWQYRKKSASQPGIGRKWRLFRRYP